MFNNVGYLGLHGLIAEDIKRRKVGMLPGKMRAKEVKGRKKGKK